MDTKFQFVTECLIKCSGLIILFMLCLLLGFYQRSFLFMCLILCEIP